MFGSRENHSDNRSIPPVATIEPISAVLVEQEMIYKSNSMIILEYITTTAITVVKVVGQAGLFLSIFLAVLIIATHEPPLIAWNTWKEQLHRSFLLLAACLKGLPVLNKQ